jgi:hypothetical protein
MVALGSYFFCRSKRDWAWLAGGMAFTLGADYFLILQNAHLTGIAVFTFTHVCYALRTQYFNRKRVIFVFSVVGAAVVMISAVNELTVLAGFYASLFAINIRLNIKHRKTMHNAPLILTGLILFALCDVCVLLFNIPRLVGALPMLERVYPLIWIFYLPAQTLLAVSAVNFKPADKRSDSSHGTC